MDFPGCFTGAEVSARGDGAVLDQPGWAAAEPMSPAIREDTGTVARPLASLMVSSSEQPPGGKSKCEGMC